MLKFEDTGTHYRIIEIVNSPWRDTKPTTVDYTYDLSEKRCNNDPFVSTNESDRNWFNKHYRHKFEKEA